MDGLLLRRVGIPSSLDHRQSFAVLDYHLSDCDRRPPNRITALARASLSHPR